MQVQSWAMPLHDISLSIATCSWRSPEMRNLLRLCAVTALALPELLLSMPQTAWASCSMGTEPNNAAVGPFDICCPGSYGWYCSASGQSWFCDDSCSNCVRVTDPEMMPTIDSKC